MIHVLIVDDDAMVADLNRQYVNRVDGFCCCGIATSLAEAGAVLNAPARQVDLILLDVYMQRDNGLSLLPVIRASGRDTDVIMITSASDAATIQTAMHYGVVDYLIKPFQFPRFEEALNGWREKKALMGSHQYHDQADVDRLLRGARQGWRTVDACRKGSPRRRCARCACGLTPIRGRNFRPTIWLAQSIFPGCPAANT